MRLASWSCNFRSPVNIIPDIAGGSDYGYYTTYTIWALLLQEARSQNTELGPDLDPLSSTMRFQRIPIHAVPYLTTNNTYPVNPIYGINWNTWKLALLKGEFLKRRGPFRSPTCHTTHTTWIDCTYNWACVDPRRNFVGYTSTTT
jgi:hypothetical protein